MISTYEVTLVTHEGLIHARQAAATVAFEGDFVVFRARGRDLIRAIPSRRVHVVREVSREDVDRHPSLRDLSRRAREEDAALEAMDAEGLRDAIDDVDLE